MAPFHPMVSWQDLPQGLRPAPMLDHQQEQLLAPIHQKALRLGHLPAKKQEPMLDC